MDERHESDSDHERQVGEALDEYFEALRRGEPSIHDDSGDSEVAQLLPVIDDLHELACVLSSGSEVVTNDDSISRVGKYHVERQLGHGGQSTTLLAMDPDLHRRVVIKLYDNASMPDATRAVLKEGRMLAQVKNPHVAQCFGSGWDNNHPYLVLEYVPGTHLGAHVPMDVPRALDVMEQLTVGLAATHEQGVLHQDLKPANVVVDDSGKAVIVDLGLARTLFRTPSERIAGTAAYMAPEQANGQFERIDRRSDIFGLGAILYELLTGKPPYDSRSRSETRRLAKAGIVGPPKSIRSDIPDQVNDLCMRCLAQHPSDRFATAEELQAAIQRVRSRRLPFRRYLPVVAASMVLIATVIGIAAFAGRRPLEPEEARVDAAYEPNRLAIPDEALEFFAVDGRIRRDFDLQVEVLGASPDNSGVVQLDDQQEVYLRITAARPCYITVLYYGPDPPTQLFPLFPIEEPGKSFFRAGVPRIVPDSPADEDAEFTPILARISRGKEAICVVASTRPVLLAAEGSPDGGFLIFGDPHQRSRLNRGLRSLVREKRTSGRAVSQVIIPFRVSPAE